MLSLIYSHVVSHSSLFPLVRPLSSSICRISSCFPLALPVFTIALPVPCSPPSVSGSEPNKEILVLALIPLVNPAEVALNLKRQLHLEYLPPRPTRTAGRQSAGSRRATMAAWCEGKGGEEEGKGKRGRRRRREGGASTGGGHGLSRVLTGTLVPSRPLTTSLAHPS